MCKSTWRNLRSAIAGLFREPVQKEPPRFPSSFGSFIGVDLARAILSQKIHAARKIGARVILPVSVDSTTAQIMFVMVREIASMGHLDGCSPDTAMWFELLAVSLGSRILEASTDPQLGMPLPGRPDEVLRYLDRYETAFDTKLDLAKRMLMAALARRTRDILIQ